MHGFRPMLGSSTARTTAHSRRPSAAISELAEEPATEGCTFNGGGKGTCYRITVTGDPVDYNVGPFYPVAISDGTDKGGTWFDGDNLYAVDGCFIESLAETYKDAAWRLYDDEGNVMSAVSDESALVAAILASHALGLFDDAAATSPYQGYHLHGALGCSQVGATSDGETPKFCFRVPLPSQHRVGEPSDPVPGRLDRRV